MILFPDVSSPFPIYFRFSNTLSNVYRSNNFVSATHRIFSICLSPPTQKVFMRKMSQWFFYQQVINVWNPDIFFNSDITPVTHPPSQT
ncbi:WD repeat-containing 65 [Gossypium arboreum]|uniref:WD repeat-containing 65 n=1 Tax=Gossypium arboreum TaxID=29729 RepID=A0A0B0M7U3_GOSAR|nr:WD repeat-containing 65 [Gossypium arboreum]KHG23282.1 WD repeat-containing 65 [Gossypium arboreum]